MLTLRIDVDYPYPSRNRSFVYTALDIRVGTDYLKNSKVIARMINESPKEVIAHWFFTLKTIPDKELLALLDNDRHDIGIHVVNDPKKETQILESATQKKVTYYTIHGTARLLGRIIWKRWKTKRPTIPSDFKIQSFHQFKTSSLDVICHIHTVKRSLEIAKELATEGNVLHFHPIWLFQRGAINHRGPFYETLKGILEVDKELETLVIRKKGFARISSDREEYAKDVVPTSRFIEKLGERGIDIFTFIERKWCCTIPKPSNSWVRTEDNIALLQVSDYAGWWENIGKKTRNMVRKAEKSGIKTEVAEPNEKLAEGIWRIYNETPIRQERAFPHYGESLHAVTRAVLSAQNCTFIAASYQSELAGFVQLVHGDKLTLVSQILSLQKHADKAVNNALIAKAVEVCAAKQVGWIMYGRMGNHPSLDKFKMGNGFTKFPLTRFYVPVTRKGRIAVRMGFHREVKDVLPQSIKYRLIPFYNWVSRNKIRLRRRLSS